MKRKNRILAGLLILVLMATMGATAFAEEQEEDWAKVYEAHYYKGQLSYEFEYFYTPEGKTAEVRTHTLNSDGTETLEFEIYFYNQEDQITRTETRDAETEEVLESSVWEYDENGRLKRILRYGAEGSLQHEQRNFYSPEGTSTIRSISYDDNGEVLSQWVTRYNEFHESYYTASFDEDGERVYVMETEFDEDGRKVSGTHEGYGSSSVLRYLYDAEGVLQESIETQMSGYAEGRVTRTLYYYDKHGNVTEELSLMDGEVTSRTVRTWILRGEASGTGTVSND